MNRRPKLQEFFFMFNLVEKPCGLIASVKFFQKYFFKRFVHFFSFSQASLLLWTLDDAKERVRNPALSLSLHTHPAQVPLACHLITLDTARGLKYEKKYLPSAFYVGER